MKLSHAKLLAALFVLLYACPGWSEMKIFPSKQYDISQYNTYTWLPVRIFTMKEIKDSDPVYSPLIHDAINSELVKKGYQEVPEGGQLQVVSAGISTVSSQLEGYLVSFGFAYYNTAYLGGVPAVAIQRVNREGALALTLYDPKLKVGVWSGYITEALGRPGNPGKKIDDAAAKLLKKLPKKQ